MTIERFDHIVLTVRNIEITCEFYKRVLGMEMIEQEGRRALRFSQSKINLHETGHEFDPKADQPTPGSADICLITQYSSDDVLKHLLACQVEVLDGPVTRSGALGAMSSVYFRDPDLNLIEVSTY